MSLPNVARQYPLTAFIDVVFGDVPDHATEYSLCEVPLGSIVTRISMFVVTAFAGSSTTEDGDIGDTTLTTRYTDGTPAEFDATGIPSNLPSVTGFKTTSSEPNITLKMTYGTTTASPNAGAVRILIDYVTSGRNNENMG